MDHGRCSVQYRSSFSHPKNSSLGGLHANSSTVVQDATLLLPLPQHQHQALYVHTLMHAAPLADATNLQSMVIFPGTPR